MPGFSVTAPIVIRAVLCVLVVLGLYYLGDSYLDMKKVLASTKTSLKDMADLRDTAVEKNRTLSSQIETLTKDAKDKEVRNTVIETEKRELQDDFYDLNKTLQMEIAKRKLAETKPGTASCSPPTPAAPEVDITWKAYCRVSGDPSCKEVSP